LFQEVARSNPNSIFDDQKAITFGGKNYTKVAEIGAGASNTVSRYKAEDDTTVVIRTAVKAVLEEAGVFPTLSRSSDVQDLVKHRLASTGDGIGASNVVKLFGVLATDNQVFGVFEDCAGGDTKAFARGTHAAAETGVLPPTVKNSMISEMFRETALGMKRLSDQGMRTAAS
jgi:hypothetical protein